MRKALILTMALFSVVACVHAQAETTDNNGLTVVTDNFKVVDAGSTDSISTLSSSDDSSVIGSLGDKKVVTGEKDEKNIAYVKTPDDRNYIIKNTILVKCARNTECIAAGLEAEKVSKTVYEVTVHSYDDWNSVQDELRRTPGVINVAPSFYQGIKPELK